MAHPNLEHAVAFCRGKVFNALEQFGMAMRTHFGITKFTGMACFYLAAQLLRHGLHAVANAENRNAQLKHCIRGPIVDFINAGV